MPLGHLASQTAEKERAAALKALKRGRQELSGIPVLLNRHVMPDGKETAQTVMCVHTLMVPL